MQPSRRRDALVAAVPAPPASARLSWPLPPGSPGQHNIGSGVLELDAVTVELWRGLRVEGQRMGSGAVSEHARRAHSRPRRAPESRPAACLPLPRCTRTASLTREALHHAADVGGAQLRHGAHRGVGQRLQERGVVDAGDRSGARHRRHALRGRGARGGDDTVISGGRPRKLVRQQQLRLSLSSHPCRLSSHLCIQRVHRLYHLGPHIFLVRRQHPLRHAVPAAGRRRRKAAAADERRRQRGRRGCCRQARRAACRRRQQQRAGARRCHCCCAAPCC